MRTLLRGKITLLFMTCAVVLAIPAIALADNFQNTLASTESGTRTITTDGTTAGSTTVGYRVIATGGDGSPTGPGTSNCNASDGTPLGVSFSVANVTASPSSLSFTSCGTANTQNVEFSSKTPGTYIIDPGLSDTGTSTYTDQSAFTLHVQGTGTSVTDVSGSGTEGQSNGSLSATLVWNNNNVGGKEVSFAIDKAKDGTFTTVGSATTDDTTGVATLNNVSLAGLAPGTYDLKATFAGDSNYAGDDTTGTLTVNSACTAPSVTTHPSAQDITYGANASFTAAASGTSPSVQWQVNTGSGFTNISDATNATLSLTKPPVSDDGNQYRAVFTNSCGTATSNAATLTVNPKALTITGLSAQDKVFDNNRNATITGTAALDGVISPDVVTLTGTPSGLFNNALVGNDKPVTVSGLTLSGADAGNYSLTQLVLHADILPWTLNGFFAPVDYDTTALKVWNTVKGGATVPLKFEIFKGSTESSNTLDVGTFIFTGVVCPGASAATDDIEITTTGGTQLRYDTTAGQFIQNWQTPKKPGACYDVTMETDDGSRLRVAHFMLK